MPRVPIEESIICSDLLSMKKHIKCMHICIIWPTRAFFTKSKNVFHFGKGTIRLGLYIRNCEEKACRRGKHICNQT